MLRVPIYGTARPASDMAAIQNQLIFGETGAISLTGEGFNTSGGGALLPPPDLASMVTAVELQ